MSRNLPQIWPLLVLALTSEVWALGLGDIRLNSALNEPLRAEIELLSAMPEELQILDVFLASAETFERYGLDRPLFLQQINFNIVSREGVEGNVIAITSLEPITELRISFLVEATWLRGRLLREYTLFLEPSTFALQPDTKSATTVTDPRQSSQTDSGMIERPSRLQTELPPSRPAQVLSSSSALPPQASFDTIGGGDYLVQQGDTLWSITQRVRLDNRLTMHQTMLAIFEANPEVFTGNINMMMVGANLRIPSAAEISRANRRDALSEVQRENAAWSSITSDVGTQPDLVLVPPDDDQTSYDGSVRETEPGVGAVTTAERIRQIEQQIADQELLVEIRGDNLSALRDESARFRNEEIAEPVVLDNVDATLADDDATIDTTLKPMANDDDGIIAADTSEDIRIDDAGAVKDTELDITTMALPRVVTLPAELGIGERMIKLLSGFWRILIGGLLIVLGILFWFSRRAARGDDEDLTGMWNALDSNEDDESPIERLVPEDVSGDLHDAHTMMEVGTKLDLARAYVDMGDHVARSILEEVLDEGDESQKKQAQQLLDLLPR